MPVVCTALIAGAGKVYHMTGVGCNILKVTHYMSRAF